MKPLQILWAKWRLSCATEELQLFQARSDVGPLYLVNTMQHRTALIRQIRRLENT